VTVQVSVRLGIEPVFWAYDQVLYIVKTIALLLVCGSLGCEVIHADGTYSESSHCVTIFT